MSEFTSIESIALRDCIRRARLAGDALLQFARNRSSSDCDALAEIMAHIGSIEGALGYAERHSEQSDTLAEIAAPMLKEAA
jgi:hypothetical protein